MGPKATNLENFCAYTFISNQRNRDKLKDDAISQLSDQLVALSTRLQEMEEDSSIRTSRLAVTAATSP
jgi:hypothetical protein